MLLFDQARGIECSTPSQRSFLLFEHANESRLFWWIKLYDICFFISSSPRVYTSITSLLDLFIYLQRISLEAEAEKITVFAGCVCTRMNRTNVNNVWIVIKIVVWFLKESYFEWVKMALLCNWFHEIRTPPANHSISTDLGLCMLQPRRDFRTAPLLHYAYNS